MAAGNGTDSFITEELFTPQFFVFAASSCLITSVFGLLCNVYLLIKFCLRSGQTTGFQKTCLVKTVPNIVVCSSFLFWAVPLTILQMHYEDVSESMNSVVGCLAGTWAYFLSWLLSRSLGVRTTLTAPILKVCLSANRFYVLYFPFGIKFTDKIPMANVILVMAVLVTTMVTTISVKTGWRYVYDPDLLQWRPRADARAEYIVDWVAFSIAVLAFTSYFFNLATSARLLLQKMKGVSHAASKLRRRKYKIAFVQNVIQDFILLFDIINATYIWKLCDEPWFQFLFLTLSFVVVFTLDGFVMLACHPDIQPKWCQNLSKRKIMSVRISFMKVAPRVQSNSI